jgi:hypothetical protein
MVGFIEIFLSSVLTDASVIQALMQNVVQSDDKDGMFDLGLVSGSVSCSCGIAVVSGRVKSSHANVRRHVGLI